ncbi:2-C-methyl-D-erythritol 4-phosphate cytidylyltransferase [Denitrobacterium detoxificans]|uniref:2-C-methyl-D-erythritol 4-phosphate cytidylyltransferase n=1 Tax=Denitrobacterium detoxificans TaxID=79604 RepID=A0A172RWP2_9ACTN|nr:2-C-methyl-D-erythritol 4-phosphate cytidylyltransferase [Denitrobacterium detoxificans]ANE22033.1 2-C-methyl-D-erythritol 4-phosphate cytidylyltransferase [Denitrobacterium detoxificans]SEO95246.1 2-C-methyl-D-erythritol 4-phosphate cytidylyltransferase [Denitrobacterium detoxificans]
MRNVDAQYNLAGTMDPIYAPSALRSPEALISAIDFDALTQNLVGLEGKVDKEPKTAAIILAGGQGERFGRDGGKQLVEIAGKPVLTWSAEAFDAVGDVGLIVVVCPKERQAEYLARAIDPFPFVTPVVMAPAGDIRQESAFSGLEYVDDRFEFVVLHDGARPLISPELIAHTISVLKGNVDADGAVVAHPSVDTLKVVENGVIMGTPDRTVFWNAQTPQVFRTGIYRRAHASALSDGFVGTDDASLIERLGGKVLVVEGKRDNIKLTVPEDYLMLAAAVHTMLRERAGEQE